MREEAHKSPVEDASRDERVDITNVEPILECQRAPNVVRQWKDLQMLAAFRHTDSRLDIVDKAREWRAEADDEGGHGSPVCGVFG